MVLLDANSKLLYGKQLCVMHVLVRVQLQEFVLHGGMEDATVKRNASSFGVVANQQTRLLCKQESNEGSTRRLHHIKTCQLQSQLIAEKSERKF